jgi:hypothetical protein
MAFELQQLSGLSGLWALANRLEELAVLAECQGAGVPFLRRAVVAVGEAAIEQERKEVERR